MLNTYEKRLNKHCKNKLIYSNTKTSDKGIKSYLERPLNELLKEHYNDKRKSRNRLC